MTTRFSPSRRGFLRVGAAGLLGLGLPDVLRAEARGGRKAKADGAILVWLSYLVHWGETEDPGLKLAVFSTGPAIRNTAANLITEIIGTFLLVFGVAAIFENEAAAALGAFFVGLLVLGIGMALGGPTGYAINPARDLGPRIIHAILPIPGKGSSDWEYSWIPVVGPIIGGVIGAFAAKAIFDL